MKNFSVRLLSLLLIILLVYLQYHLWFSDTGILEVRDLKTNIASLQAENASLKQTNTKLWFQIDRLKHNREATEEKARNELGMIKKGETYYQFVR